MSRKVRGKILGMKQRSLKIKTKSKIVKSTDGYEYEAFISYKRLDKESIKWMQEIFIPCFHRHLRLAISNTAKIFFDYGIETGSNWPAKLAEGLAKSKILVGLWCRPYFESIWCKTELSLMYARERKYKFATRKNPQRLIVPATLHDGDDFPKKARMIQPKDLRDYFNVRLAEKSPRMEMLETVIGNWMPDIVRAIKAAPNYSPGLSKVAYKSFMKAFSISSREQTKLPNIGNK